jgi:hypothetical protein
LLECTPTLLQYQIGQLYSVAKTSNLETHDDAGVEILKNEPFENEEMKGQYTHKIYHLGRSFLFCRFSLVALNFFF